MTDKEAKVVRATLEAPENPKGQRLDQLLAQQLGDFSRSRLTQWIKQGFVQVEGRPAKPSAKVFGGEAITVEATLQDQIEDHAQPLELDLIHSDPHFFVVNKPPGLVVHPAAGHADGTLLNALLNLDAELKQLPRAGIVHRLDKDTSGLLVVARTLTAHASLVRQLEARSVKREYWALVYGALVSGDTVDLPLGRHPVDRKRVAVRDDGKPAVTHYRLLNRFMSFTELTVRLETGRTHQIRVHLSHQRWPIVGDQVYGGRFRPPAAAGDNLLEVLRGHRRQALHARTLAFDHPGSGDRVSFDAPLPDDLMRLSQAVASDPGQRLDG
ncbi:MAG: 23S rRNA pseudouridine(1911/1915/1917) synthase RluD [Lysobacterales bacterium]